VLGVASRTVASSRPGVTACLDRSVMAWSREMDAIEVSATTLVDCGVGAADTSAFRGVAGAGVGVGAGIGRGATVGAVAVALRGVLTAGAVDVAWKCAACT
jgi:hypothetical protein